MSEEYSHAIAWFEIPVSDMNRARTFYSTILQRELTLDEPSPGYPMAFFPMREGAVSGALVKGEGYRPSQDGTIVYLTADPDIDAAVGRVEEAGDQIHTPAFDTPWGRMAYIIDTEGNRVALYHNPGGDE